jgi:exodeoxyribonuclease-5
VGAGLSNIELTEGQNKGLELAQRLIREPRSVGVICGYAGTGKTTLIKAVFDTIGHAPVLLSPTGKAAARITEVTGRGAGTIHRWLYKPQDRGAYVSFTKKPINEIHRPESGLLIIDESSMLGPEVWNDVQETAFALDCSILLVGDGFQLPPVQDKGEEPFSVLGTDFVPPQFRVELTEILRQALDSPIIRSTMAIREGEVHEALMDLDTLLPAEFDAELVTANMVICRSNKWRHWLNAKSRFLRGINGDEPQLNEPLLVLRNNALDVYNGEVHAFNGFVDNLGTRDVFDYDTNARVGVQFKMTPLANGKAILAPKVLGGELEKLTPSQLEKAVSYWQRQGEAFYVHANYGYALTCHKAQGSEADYVLVCMEPRFNYTSEDGRRWLYTALSRAKKRVSIAHIS